MAPLTTLWILEQGVPSIVSDCCDARDYVEESINGLLFMTGDGKGFERIRREMLERSLAPKSKKIEDWHFLDCRNNLYGRLA